MTLKTSTFKCTKLWFNYIKMYGEKKDTPITACSSPSDVSGTYIHVRWLFAITYSMRTRQQPIQLEINNKMCVKVNTLRKQNYQTGAWLPPTGKVETARLSTHGKYIWQSKQEMGGRLTVVALYSRDMGKRAKPFAVSTNSYQEWTSLLISWHWYNLGKPKINVNYCKMVWKMSSRLSSSGSAIISVWHLYTQITFPLR